MGTERMTGFRIIICSSMEFFTTKIANKVVGNDFRFLRTIKGTKFSFRRSRFEIFSAIITGDYRHVSFDVINSARKYTIKKLKVYDITVENEHCFYANNVLVHNCDECASMQGRVFTLDEIEPMIPKHINCRCFTIPVLKNN